MNRTLKEVVHELSKSNLNKFKKIVSNGENGSKKDAFLKVIRKEENERNERKVKRNRKKGIILIKRR